MRQAIESGAGVDELHAMFGLDVELPGPFDHDDEGEDSEPELEESGSEEVESEEEESGESEEGEEEAGEKGGEGI